MVTTIILIDNRNIRLLVLTLLSNPSIAFFDILITTKSKGNTTGKLNIAIKEVLFEALEAIPEFIVRTDANPIDPRIRFRRNNPMSLTGFPRIKL